MLVFNTTYLVSDRQFGPWSKWVREVHIPFMLENGFVEPRVAKVLSDDEEQEGNSISVQFNISDMDRLNAWKKTKAQEFEAGLVEMFGYEVLSFSTVLELM